MSREKRFSVMWVDQWGYTDSQGDFLDEPGGGQLLDSTVIIMDNISRNDPQRVGMILDAMPYVVAGEPLAVA